MHSGHPRRMELHKSGSKHIRKMYSNYKQMLADRHKKFKFEADGGSEFLRYCMPILLNYRYGYTPQINCWADLKKWAESHKGVAEEAYQFILQGKPLEDSCAVFTEKGGRYDYRTKIELGEQLEPFLVVNDSVKKEPVQPYSDYITSNFADLCYAWCLILNYAFSTGLDSECKMLKEVGKRLAENCDITYKDICTDFSTLSGYSDELMSLQAFMFGAVTSAVPMFASRGIIYSAGVHGKALFGYMMTALFRNRVSGIVKTIYEYEHLAVASLKVIRSSQFFDKSYWLKRREVYNSYLSMDNDCKAFFFGIWDLQHLLHSFIRMRGVDSFETYKKEHTEELSQAIVDARDVKGSAEKYAKNLFDITHLNAFRDYCDVDAYIKEVDKLEEELVVNNDFDMDSLDDEKKVIMCNNYGLDLFRTTGDRNAFMQYFMPSRYGLLDKGVNNDFNAKMCLTPCIQDLIISCSSDTGIIDFCDTDIFCIEEFFKEQDAEGGVYRTAWYGYPTEGFKTGYFCSPACAEVLLATMFDMGVVTGLIEYEKTVKTLGDKCKKAETDIERYKGKVCSYQDKLKVQSEQYSALQKSVADKIANATNQLKDELKIQTDQTAELGNLVDNLSAKLADKTHQYSSTTKKLKSAMSRIQELEAKLQELTGEQVEPVTEEPTVVSQEEKIAFLNQFNLLVAGGMQGFGSKLESAGLTNVTVLNTWAEKRPKVKFDYMVICTTNISHTMLWWYSNLDKTGRRLLYFNNRGVSSFIDQVYDDITMDKWRNT